MAGEDTGTLGKLMSVLDAIASCDEPPRFSDILVMTGEPRGTLHRHLRHLVGEGLAEVDGDGRYRPGLRLLNLASRAWETNDLRRIARPHLEALGEAVGETVHLGVLRGAEIVYIDKVEARQAVRMYSRVGNASPVHCTGIGKAAISTFPDKRLRDLLRSLTFRRFTPSTVSGAEEFARQIDQVRQQGFAFDLEEHEQGIRCVAVPVSARGVAAGVSVTAPAYRAQPERMEEWKAPLKRAAAAINAELEARLGPVQFLEEK
jgi:IclR family transcriptional regulator, acetate operon repressor